MKQTKSIHAAAALAFIFLSADTKAAGLVISFDQNGPDLSVKATGTLDVAGLLFYGDIGSSGNEIGNNGGSGGRVYSGLVSGDDFYATSLAHDLFKTTEVFETYGTPSGDSFGLYTAGWNTFIYVPDGFTSGAVNGELTIPNVNLADLEVQAFNYSWGPGAGQSIQVVPEPSSSVFFALAAGALMLRRRAH